VGFADQIFISKTELVSKDETDALMHRIKHMNPRAPQKAVHFGEVPLKDIFDLRGFNLNAKLDIDPDFLKEEEEHDHDHDHAHGDHCDHDHDAQEGHATTRTTTPTTTTSRASCSRSTVPSTR
jgi:G3E family GTPase